MAKIFLIVLSINVCRIIHTLKKNYQLITIDLSKKEILDTDLKTV